MAYMTLDRVSFLAYQSWTGYIIVCKSVLKRVWTCPRQGMVAKLSLLNMPYTVFLLNSKMEGVVLNRIGTVGLFCLKQRQGFRPLAAPLNPHGSGATPPPFHQRIRLLKIVIIFVCQFQNAIDGTTPLSECLHICFQLFPSSKNKIKHIRIYR